MATVRNTPIITPQTLVGPAPVSMQLFDYQQATNHGFSSTAPIQGLLKLNVPRNEINRKLYGWIWSNANVGQDFSVRFQLVFLKANTDIGRLPFEIGNSINDGTSLVKTPVISTLSSAVSVAGAAMGAAGVATAAAAVENSIIYSPESETPTIPQQVILFPLTFQGELEQIRLDFIGMDNSNATSARVFIACISNP